MSKVVTKKIISIIIAFVMILIFCCCGSDKKICSHDKCGVYKQFGIADSHIRDENIEYELVIGNVIWSIILIETVAVPIILLGWYLYEPVGPSSN